MNHFDEMTCLLYLDGQLEAGRARELTAHAGECADCRALLRALEQEGLWLRQALTDEDEAVPARLLEPPVRAPMPWGWIAALGFGAAGAYTLWMGLVEPVRQELNLAGFNGGNLLTMLLFHGALWKGWEIMRSLIEFVAIATLGAGVFTLLRRGLRRSTTVGLVMGALAVALMLPSSAAAAEIHKGQESYTLAAGQTVNNDLIVAAGIVRIEGTVDGDVIAFGQSVRVNGHVTGDVICFSQEARIGGQVDGNLRIFTRGLVVDGQVGKNATIFMDTSEFDPKSQIGRNLYLFGGVVTLDGRVVRDVFAYAGRGHLNGFIGGDLMFAGQRLVIDSLADIHGHALYRGSHQPEVVSGAKLASPLEVHLQSTRPDYASPRFYWRQLLAFGAAFVFGLVLLLLMPGFFADVVRAGNRFGISLGFGALLLIATPILAVISCITIFGLGVGIGTLFLYFMALYATQSFIGLWIGEKILGLSTGIGSSIGRLALGLLLIRIARALPYIGGWLLLLVILWGLGAQALSIYKRMGRQAVAA
jgi:cytoskeletal protein CcmA (bactofilin family)